MPLQLDWLNWFGGLTGHQIVSVIVAFVIFLANSGLMLLGLIAFGARSGIMAPAYTSKVPAASDLELAAFLAAFFFGLISMAFMVFLGLAENLLDNPLFLPLTVGPILIGGLFLITGAGLAFRTVRRGHRVARPS